MSLKESQGILDYESLDVLEKSFTVDRSVNIFKGNKDIVLKHSNVFSSNNSQFVSKITALNDGYSINPSDFQDENQGMWLVTKPDTGVILFLFLNLIEYFIVFYTMQYNFAYTQD